MFQENLLSISALDAKGIRVSFVDGQVLMWPRGKTIKDAIVIGEEDGGLYKLKGQCEEALVHVLREPNELWQKNSCTCALIVHYQGQENEY